MTDNWFTDDDDNTQDEQGNPNLVKSLRDALKEKTKAEKTLETQLTTLTARVRAQDVGAVLKEAGVNEKVASLIPTDVEPTAEAVGKWLEEYKDVFGIKTEETAPPEPDPNVVSQITAMNNVAQSGQTPNGPANVTLQDVQSAGTLEELRALIAKAGGRTL